LAVLEISSWSDAKAPADVVVFFTALV